MYSTRKIAVVFLALLLMAPLGVVGGEESVRDIGSRQNLSMTLYLQNTTDSHYVFDYSTTQVFNTNVGNRSSFVGNNHIVMMSWYLHPVLAGDLYVQGDITVWIYLNFTGTNPNGNLRFVLKELSYKLDKNTEDVVWQQTSPNQGVNLETGINSYSVTLPNVDRTFSAGNSIALELELSGGNSVYFGMWCGNATYDSRVEFDSWDHMAFEDAYTLDYQDVPTIDFEFDVADKTVKIRANLSDPFGGYDIQDVRCTLRDPDGAVIIDNETMALINGTPISFYSVFESLWDYTGAEPGRYNVTIWAVDNNGYNFYWHREQYTYDGYEQYAYADFWVGGLPANYMVTVQDSRSDPLPGALVTADRGGKIVFNTTNAAGQAGLALYPTQYTIKVYWEDVEVGNVVVDAVDGGSVTIVADVFYPVIEVVDANGDPLQGTSVFEIHPNGTVFLTPHITNASGQFAKYRAAGGDYTFVVKWRDVEVANTVVTIDANQVYTISAQVFTLTVIVQDSHGEPLAGAQVVVTEEFTRIVFDSKLTNLDGQMTTQLPVGTYDINAYWAENDVGGEMDYYLDANANIVISCEVYYVTIQTVDSQDEPVSDAQVMVLSSVTGSLLGSGRTGDDGMTTLRLPVGNHEYLVHWRDIMVASGSDLNIVGDIPDTNPFKIVVEVYYAAIRVEDSRGEPLAAALITVTSQAGGVFDFIQTSGNGTAIVRVPRGTHVIFVQWKGVDIAHITNFTVTADIPLSAPYVIRADVFYLTVKVLDSREKAVPNAVINIYHQNGESADSGLTDANGQAVIRLPVAIYDIRVLWKDIVVGEIQDHNFTADGTLTINAAIYYRTFKTLDSRGLPVDKAHVTVYYQSGDVLDSARTDDYGEVFMRLPGTTVDVEVAWKGVVVGNLSDHAITEEGVTIINLEVFYLTVTVKGADNTKLSGAVVTVMTEEGATFDAGRTRGNGKAEFRVANGVYNVSVRFTSTYLMSSVDEKQEKQVVVTGDTSLNFVLEEYPPPVYTTVGFAITLFIIVLVLLLGMTYIMLSRKLRQAQEHEKEVIRHEKEEGDEEGGGEGGEGEDAKTDDAPVAEPVDEEPHEGPTGPSDKVAEEQAPSPSEEEDIDKVLEDLEGEGEVPPRGG